MITEDQLALENVLVVELKSTYLVLLMLFMMLLLNVSKGKKTEIYLRPRHMVIKEFLGIELIFSLI